VPFGPVLQYATEKPEDPIELRVYRGADGEFTLYEDQGDNYNYEKGACATIPFVWNEAKETLTIGKRVGRFPGMLKERTFRVVFVSPGHGAGMAAEEKADAVVHYTGKAVTVISKK
jgi:alpha-D-xyloside xylohydrolase